MVLEQVGALRAAGHEVQLISQHTDDVQHQPFYSARSALRVMTGRGTNPLGEIDDFGPDVVHVHNLFPNYAAAWLDQVKAPIVATLHNFRPLCANGLLFRDGKQCFSCPDGDSMAAVRHGCYHDSRIATIPLAVRNARGTHRDQLLRSAAALICLSATSASIYEQYGVGRGKLHVLPNGIADPNARREEANGRWIAVGRLTPEKGFAALISAWPAGHALDIVGDGPGADMPASLPTGVRLLGSLPRDELLSSLPHYTGLVFPSACLEMQPTVVLEAMAAGIPVVAKAGNAGADLIDECGGGGTYDSNAGLAEALRRTADGRQAYGDLGRQAFEQRFGRAKWIEGLSDLYRGILR